MHAIASAEAADAEGLAAPAGDNDEHEWKMLMTTMHVNDRNVYS